MDTAHTGATEWEKADTAANGSAVQKAVGTEWEKAETAVARPPVQKTAARATEGETADDTAVVRPTVQKTAARATEWKTVESTAAGPASGVAVAELGHDVKDEKGLSIALVGPDY